MSEDDPSGFKTPFWIKPPLNILFDLVKLKSIQPWKIDISYLLTTLAEEMGGKGYTDFSASGIALLSSSTIYRMKSERILELQEPPEAPPEEDVEILPPPLQLPYRFKYTSTTFENLVDALEEVLNEESYTESPPEPKPSPKEFPVIRELDDFMTEIEKRIDEMYSFIRSSIGENGVISFSDLVKGVGRLEAIRVFIIILFLANKDRILLRQEEEFGEIQISLTEEEMG